MSLLSGKKLLLLGFAVVLLVVIPLTVYLVQQQQKLNVGAQKASTLSFTVTPGSTSTINTASDVSKFDIMLDPSSNQVSLVRLVINFDATKLKVVSFDPNTSAFPTTLQAASFTTSPATMTVSIGQNTTSFIQSVTKVATIGFSAQPGAPPGQVQVSFDQTVQGTQVLSLASSDQFNENVLLSASPTTVTIAQAIAGGTATPTPTPSPTPVASGQVPVCTSSSVDKSTSGTAPYAINLEAKGTDSSAVITKVTYNWGDTQTQDYTQGFGIGTNAVDITENHTYTNGGNFTATVTFTDSNGRVSQIGNCTKTFTITGATPTPTAAPSGSTSGSGTSNGTGGTSTGGTTTTQVATVGTTGNGTATGGGTLAPGGTTTKGGLPASGPGDNIISLGTLGIISTIVGALLLFGL